MALLDNLLAEDTLTQAWERVRSNGGAPGVDGIDIDEFGRNALIRITRLRDQLRDGRYQPTPLLRVELPRPGREPRLLGIPSVRDRVLQTAAALVLGPLLDRHFEDESYAYRPGRSVRDAIARVAELRDRGLAWIVDADIRAFFDNIPHRDLLARLAALLPDNSLLPLIRQWLTTPVQTAEACLTPSAGVAQGSPLSPLLANLYLDGFDEAITAVDGRHLVRYGDDFVIVCGDSDSAERALEDAALWLRAAGLDLNYDKTRIALFRQGVRFLGVLFDEHGQRAEDPAAEVWLLQRHLRPARAAAPLPEPAMAPLPAVPADLSPAKPAARAPSQAARPGRGVRHDDPPPPLLRTLYLAEPGAYLRVDGGRILVLRNGEEVLSVPMEKVDQVLVADEGAVSFAVLRALLARGATLVVQGAPGEPVGMLVNANDSRVELRRSQYRRSEDAEFCLGAARSIVVGKIANSRLLLRRHYRFRPGGHCPADAPLREMQVHASHAVSLEALRGVEGAAARAYFSAFADLLPERWSFPGRRRQPASDPVNALLSYGYAVLFQNLLTLVAERGLDPHLACLHAVRDGHPALVSDLMEEFRALIVDAVILKLLRRDDIVESDFVGGGAGEACRIGLRVRKAYLVELEAKLQSEVTHPLGGPGGDYRRAMRAQVAHWIQVLQGEAPAYRPFLPR
ncbi:MAG TPA: CRISPR-associated endonuclease Cas1 [Accumulibacter sp.]|jgi:CRISPR-associated protein Cas1|nr:CRISPR-associated endonuclease Cas1 [Accumulibacter sp.]